MRRERRLDLTLARVPAYMCAVRARPVAQRAFVRGEVRAVSDVAERGCSDAAIESSEPVCAPNVPDDVQVGVGRGGGRTDEGLLVDFDEFGGCRY